MKVATAKEMQTIDRLTIGRYGIKSEVLMERAGIAVARRIFEDCPEGKAMVFCGSGNNGGDGLVIARELHNAGYRVKALMVGKKDALGGDCRAQLEIARKFGLPVEFRVKPQAGDLHGAFIVDAIFGTGLGREISGPLAKLIAVINASGRQVYAVDIPSGVSADTGRVLGTAVRATCTVTFGLPKRGHLLFPGAGHTGRLFVEDIGFPKGLFGGIKCNLLDGGEMALLVPRREPDAHKGDFGHVLVLGGSRGKTGAVFMAARACLKAGAGLVTMGVPEGVMDACQSSSVEEMTLSFPDNGDGSLSDEGLDSVLSFLDTRGDILAVGPGLGRNPGSFDLVRRLVTRCTAPMVLDADGLNALEGHTGLLSKASAPIVLTPHPGEFSRLSGTNKDWIEADRVGAATEFSKKTGAYVILKGAPTVIAEPGGQTFINSTGGPAMAKAGAGDVLTGLVAAFMGQGLSPLEASVLGVFLHGKAGDVAAARLGEHSVLASDIINALPEAFDTNGG